jgi:serine/threonine-protein kinase
MKIEAGAYVTPNVRLLRLLGEGGMGSVWVAQHESLGTEVAVKFLSGDYANDAAARARFSREAAAASRVKSAHVVSIYDHGITDTNVPFIVMELLQGADLAERLQAEKKLSPNLVVTIVSQLAKALERAHDAGVVHRDIKPENIFLGSEGGEVFVKLLDFGVAKTETQLQQKTTGRHSTLAGESLGTPFYMSPEQFKNSKDIDFRTDFWSVGVVVYEALTGRLPFVGDTVSAVAIVVNEANAVSPSTVEPALPKALDGWFAKSCARQPADRFQSAREQSSALREAFAMPIDSRASLPAIGEQLSQSGRVIIRAQNQTASGWNDQTEQTPQPALRDTAFATSSGSPKTARSKSWIAIAMIAAIGIIAGVGFLLSRPPKPATTTVAKETAVASVPAAPSSAPAIATPEATTAPQVSVSASAPPASSKATHVRTNPSTQPSTKPGHERDIW